MEIIYYPSKEEVEKVRQQKEPFLATIAFDGKSAIVAPMDEVVEHHIMLAKAGFSSLDIDKYFRIVFDDTGADWTFVCPSNYKNISMKSYRLKAFYKDGYSEISNFLQEFGNLVEIRIPKRYHRHLDMITDDSTPL